MKTSLSQELPYWEFFNEPYSHVVLMNGSISTGIKLGLLDIECLDAEKINGITASIRSLLNSLPDKLRLQFHISVDSDYTDVLNEHQNKRAPGTHPVIKEIDDQRIYGLEQAMSRGDLYRPNLYLFLTLPIEQKKMWAFFSKPSKFQSVSEESYKACLESLSQALLQIKSNLGALGLKARDLSRDDFISIIYKTLSPKRSLTEPPPYIQIPPQAPKEKACNLLQQSPRERLSLGDLTFSENDFSLDGKIHRIVTLKNLPEQTYSCMISNLLRLPFHYSLTLTIEVPDQASEVRRLNQRRRMTHSLTVNRGNKVSDLESESKLASTEELLRELLNTGQKIFLSELSICLKAEKSPAGRRSLNEMVRTILGKMRQVSGMECVEETVGAWKIFKSTLPLAPLSLIREKRMKTNNLADFIPIYGPRLGNTDPVVLFQNRLGGLVSFNSYSPTLINYNMLVTGSSGSGKSFVNNFITLQQLNRQTRLFIIDIGGSYRKLTTLLGGEYVEIDLSEKYSLNPFILPEGQTEPDSRKLKSLVSIVEQMVCEDEKTKLSRFERVLIEKTIVEVFLESKNKNILPTLSSLRSHCEKAPEPELKKIGVLLYSWTGSRPYGKLLDRPSGLKLESNIIAFDLKGLEQYPDLQGVLILILTDLILTAIEKDKVSFKRILLDEVWQLLKSEAASQFMEYCVRTLRKTGSGITFITQGLEEIVGSSIGSAILNNTATKLILLQEGDTKILKDHLKLNDYELSVVRNFQSRKGEFSEALLMQGQEHQIIRTCPIPLDYWVSTSDSNDNAYLSKIQSSENLSLWEATKACALSHPWGVSKLKGAA